MRAGKVGRNNLNHAEALPGLYPLEQNFYRAAAAGQKLASTFVG